MCGRTACTLAPDDICKACSYNSRSSKGHDVKGDDPKTKIKGRQQPVWRDAPGGQHYFPSYNIAPGAHTPVLISSQHYQGDLDTITERVIQPMRWGLVPSWHKGDPKNVGYETNNCRSEGMLEKKTYKVPLEKGRRCVILADGFYEWKRDKDKKQPYFIYFPQDTWVKKEEGPRIGNESNEMKLEKENQNCIKHEAIYPERSSNRQDVVDGDYVKQEPEETKSVGLFDNDQKPARPLLTMAGVFDIWSPPDNSPPLYSYSVITVESSSPMSTIHHRMPALLLNDEEIDEWLNFGDVPLRKAVMKIRPTETLQMHPVTTAVGNSRYKEPDCILPVDINKKVKPPVNTFMKNWLSKPSKVSAVGQEELTPNKVPNNVPSSKKSPKKPGLNLMTQWLQKGKRQSEETEGQPTKKFKTDVT